MAAMDVRRPPGRVATAASLAWPIQSATWAMLGFVAAGSVLLPAPFGMVTLAGVLALQLLLSWINSVKIGLTSLPLTILDVRIALANPAGLWDALALPHWTRHAATFVVAVAALSWFIAGLVAAARFVASYRTRASTRDPLLRLAAICVVAILGLSRLEALYADAALDNFDVAARRRHRPGRQDGRSALSRLLLRSRIAIDRRHLPR